MPSALAFILNFPWLVNVFCWATIYLARQQTSTLDLATPIGRIIYELKPASAVLCLIFAVLLSRAVATSLRNFNSCAVPPQPHADSYPSSDIAESLLEEASPSPNTKSQVNPAGHHWLTLIQKISVGVQQVCFAWLAGYSAVCSFKGGIAWPQTGHVQDDVVAVAVYAFRGVVNCGVVLGVGYGLYLG